MINQAQLKNAYQRAKLARHGISFEQAIETPMFNKCLSRIAEALDSIKQPPLPRHKCQQHWQDKDK